MHVNKINVDCCVIDSISESFKVSWTILNQFVLKNSIKAMRASISACNFLCQRIPIYIYSYSKLNCTNFNVWSSRYLQLFLRLVSVINLVNYSYQMVCGKNRLYALKLFALWHWNVSSQHFTTNSLRFICIVGVIFFLCFNIKVVF